MQIATGIQNSKMRIMFDLVVPIFCASRELHKKYTTFDVVVHFLVQIQILVQV